jgi:hypothetical protein
MDVKALKEEIAELEEQFERELHIKGANIDILLQQIAARKARLRQLEAGENSYKKKVNDTSDYPWI